MAAALLVSASPAKADATQAPWGLTATGTSTGVALFWHAPLSGTVLGYLLDRSDGATHHPFLVPADSTRFVDGSAPAGLVTYTVSAVFAGSVGPASNPAVAMENLTVPEDPFICFSLFPTIWINWECLYTEDHDHWPYCIPLEKDFPFAPRPDCLGIGP